MPEKITYTRSDASIEQRRRYSKRKAAAVRYIYHALKEGDRDLFDVYMAEFNATQDEPFEVKS